MRSFFQGLLLAGLPIIAFAGADYLLAPPSDTTRVDTQTREAATVARPGGAAAPARFVGGHSALPGLGHPNGVEKDRAVAPGAHPVTSKPPSDDPYSSLVAAIQRELSRVGCYAGDADGTWTGQTKVAMRAFNDSVHVTLATDNPDYILLTLLQGHNGKACSRSCNGTASASAQCIDRSIEAHRLPPAAPVTRQAAADGAGSPASPPKASAPVAPTWTTTSAREVVAAPPAHEAPQPQRRAVTAAPTQPLPGRMAIGAAPSSEPEPADRVAVAPRDSVQPEHASPAARSRRPAPVARPAASPSSGNSRLSRTFTELSRNSP